MSNRETVFLLIPVIRTVLRMLAPSTRQAKTRERSSVERRFIGVSPMPHSSRRYGRRHVLAPLYFAAQSRGPRSRSSCDLLHIPSRQGQFSTHALPSQPLLFFRF